MHTRNIIYCLEHGIPAAADGPVRTQSDHPEMMPGVLNEWARFYAEHNVRFLEPKMMSLHIYVKKDTASGRSSVRAITGRSSPYACRGRFITFGIS